MGLRAYLILVSVLAIAQGGYCLQWAVEAHQKVAPFGALTIVQGILGIGFIGCGLCAIWQAFRRDLEK